MGTIPGKQTILNFLGLSRSNQQEQGRPLNYVPSRILELQPPSGGEESTSSPLPISPLSSPGVVPGISPSPLISMPSPNSSNPGQPPPPPPFVLGVNDKQNLSVSPSKVSDSTNTKNEDVGDEDVWQTIKNYFSGIF